MAQVRTLTTGLSAGSLARHGHLESCSSPACSASRTSQSAWESLPSLRPSVSCSNTLSIVGSSCTTSLHTIVSSSRRSLNSRAGKCTGLCARKVRGWAASELMGEARRVVAKGFNQRRGRIPLIVRAGAGPPPSESDIVATLLDVDEADRQKSEGMQFRRTVFTFNDWKRHRSSGRYVRHIATMFGSRVISSLGPAVFAITSLSVLVCIINTMVLKHQLPAWMPLLRLNALPFSLTSSALSFLLVFRTNASYGRFDEARKMWGLMLNRSRDIARQALSYMARGAYEHERPKMLQFLRHLQAFPLAYKHHLLQEGDLETDLKTHTSLTEEEIKAILEATHRPNFVLQMCSECMAQSHMDPAQRLCMDQNMTTFADDVGGSERIFKTPIPLSYTRLTSRFMVLWHLLLPFGLWDSCGVLTIPAAAFITALLFCVEEVGVLIEEPFSILALGVIAESARNNVAELLKLHDRMKARVVPNDPIVSSKPVSPSYANGAAAEAAVPAVAGAS